jgi:hypothetical protein
MGRSQICKDTEVIMIFQQTTRSARHELLDFVQHKLVKLGALRFQSNEAPQLGAHDVIAWAILLYEQSADLHRQMFDEAGSSANDLRLSRQALNSQLSSLMVLAMSLAEQL